MKSGARRLAWVFLPSQAIMYEPSSACAVNEAKEGFSWLRIYQIRRTGAAARVQARLWRFVKQGACLRQCGRRTILVGDRAMNWLTVSLPVALLTMTAMNARSDNRDAKKDALQGKWDSTVWFDGSFSRHGSCTIQDDKIEDRARAPAGGVLFLRYRLNSEATPKEIDLIAPPREGPLYKGYYEEIADLRAWHDWRGW